MGKREATAIVQLKLRLRESLRAQLEGAAKGNATSLNQEMTRRLAESFGPRGGQGDEVLAELRAIRALLREVR